MSTLESRLGSGTAWVDPSSLPKYGDASEIGGNAPDYVKQLTSNVLGAYGVGDRDSFAYSVGRKIKLVEVSVDQRGDKWEATAVAEVTVCKGMWRCASVAVVGLNAVISLPDMLNGAGMMHGGCMCYIIDKYATSIVRATDYRVLTFFLAALHFLWLHWVLHKASMALA